jgi:transposase InsO family protein
VIFFAAHGTTARRLMTDNAFSYTKNRSLRELLPRINIRHLTTRPDRPRTNGKIERYQQTLAREWAYGQRYRSSKLAPQRCPSGSTTPTPPATTAPSQTGHPSAAFGTTRGTTASRRFSRLGTGSERPAR